MTAMEWLWVALYLGLAAASIWFYIFWVMPAVARFLLGLNEKPDSDDELATAWNDLSTEIGKVLLPPVERLVAFLSRHLPHDR